MPHMSPMMWMMTFPLFWLFFTIILTFTWWSAPISFPLTPHSMHHKPALSWQW